MTMTLKQTRKRNGQQGTGWVLFGCDPSSAARKWVEKWFPTSDKARAYARKKGWTIKGETSAPALPRPEHTCGGLAYDWSCPACNLGEPDNQRGNDDGGITSDSYGEPEDWDVAGGL